jgi:cytoskeletal protein CcmA (bactofilin family)
MWYRGRVHLAPAVIPAHATVTGAIDTPGDVTLEGRLEGELRAGGAVTVAANATCMASVFARSLVIYGELIGNAVCTETIRVAAGARAVGDLRAPDVEVDSASEVDGRVDLLPPEPRSPELTRLEASRRGPALPKPRTIPRAPRPVGRVRIGTKRKP